MDSSATWAGRVAEARAETPIDRTLVLAPRPGAGPFPAWRAGQHVGLVLPGEEPRRVRPYSLSGAPGPGRAPRVTVREAGAWGRPIWELGVGDAVDVAGPAGAFVREAGPGTTLLLLAGGSGVAPFRAFVEEWAGELEGPGADEHPAGRIVLVHASRHADHLVFRAEFEAWQRDHEGFLYLPTVTGEPGTWTGERGRPTLERLEAHVAAGRRTIVYACGPRALVDQAMAWAEALGVAPEDRRREG